MAELDELVDKLCDEQRDAYEQICEFLTAPRVRRPYMVVEGLAGVGKTVLLIAVAHRFRNAKLASPFGKAAANLTRKSGLRASTVHGAIYNFGGEDEETKELIFHEKVEHNDWKGRKILLDEHGVCGQKLGRDLMATGARVVAFGDPGQLPPVNDVRYFGHPDVTLQTIHRQAWDSGIIRQAHNMRNNMCYKEDGPEFRVQSFCSEQDVMEADIMLCWTNNTRRELNSLKRAYKNLIGRPPLAGEPIMCLRNDHQMGVLNGAIYELLEDHEPGCGRIKVVNEYGETVTLWEAWIEDFEGPRPDTEMGQSHPFALAYAATTHKMIGSEVNNALVVMEMRRDREDYRSWCYTAFTRAAKKVLVKV